MILGNRAGIAHEYLCIEAKKSKAITFLLECAHTAVTAMLSRVEAKRRLLQRCLHARRYQQRAEEARNFLYYTAQGILEAEARLNNEVIHIFISFISLIY
jgi:hypothetical protein